MAQKAAVALLAEQKRAEAEREIAEEKASTDTGQRLQQATVEQEQARAQERAIQQATPVAVQQQAVQIVAQQAAHLSQQQTWAKQAAQQQALAQQAAQQQALAQHVTQQQAWSQAAHTGTAAPESSLAYRLTATPGKNRKIFMAISAGVVLAIGLLVVVGGVTSPQTEPASPPKLETTHPPKPPTQTPLESPAQNLPLRIDSKPALSAREAALLKKGLSKCKYKAKYGEMLEMLGDSNEHRLALGTCAVKGKRYGEAVELYQQVLDRNPRESKALLGLAAAYERGKDPKAALAAYKQYLDSAPPKEAKKAKKSIAKLEKALAKAEKRAQRKTKTRHKSTTRNR